MRSLMRSAGVATLFMACWTLAVPLVAQPNPKTSEVTAAGASPARKACLVKKYSAHRAIARTFQRKRTDILLAAVPDAKSFLDAQISQQMAANDRLEIAFKHLIEKEPDKIVLVPETQAWMILSPSDDARLAAELTDYKQAKDREAEAVAALAAAPRVPALGRVSREKLADPKSDLSVALKEGSAAFAANDRTACP